MNPLWPAASRVSPLRTWTLLQTCRKVDSLAARLADRASRPFSASPLHSDWRESGPWKTEKMRVNHTGWGRVPAITSSIGIRAYASERETILTEFEQLTPHYKDARGLKFREKPFTEKEAGSIFGKGIDVNSANRLLRILHGRRVAGTLEDPDSPTILNVYEVRMKKVALAWLREHVPVDEVRNYGLRAEKELAEMEDEIVQDAERLGLPNSRKIGPGESVYGQSAFDAIRKRNQELEAAREAEAEEKRKKQAEEIRYNTGTLEPMSASRRVELSKPPMNERLKYYIERSKVLPNTPPDLRWYQRLWPSALLLVGVLGLCYIFPLVYTPPANSQRMFPDIPPAAATVFGLMLANSVVFLLWRFPPAFRMLNKYFITVPGYPRALSLVGNIFSHQTRSHFLINMLLLYFMGIRLHDEVGRANFLAIYFATGIFGSFTSLTYHVLRSNFVTSSLGASGAISGMIGTYLWLNRNEPVSIFAYILPADSSFTMPKWFPLSCFILIELYAIWRSGKRPPTMDHWAHLGGYVSGMMAADGLNYRRAELRKAEIERRKQQKLIDRIREGRL